MAQTTIELRNVTKHYPPDVTALDDLSFTLADGSFMALLGPSGCGKSTTLRLIAGLEAPDAGEVVLAGRPVAGGGNWLPPEKRRVGMVFQDYALFPHLTVSRNIEFSMAGLKQAARRKRVAELVETTEIDGTAQRYPHQISGGQQQRVALARALAQDPAIVLLDEPFSNLDATLRDATRREVKAILARAGTTTILVTHDQEEAISLADVVAVMFDGRIVQVGSPEEIYTRPSTRAVAEFVGASCFTEGDADGDSVSTVLGRLPLARPINGRVEVLIRPEAVRVVRSEHGAARVVAREFVGPYQRLRLALRESEVLDARVPALPRVSVGERVEASVSEPVVAFRAPFDSATVARLPVERPAVIRDRATTASRR